MANPYYTHGSAPASNSLGSSSEIRAELDSIQAGFEKLPILAGNGDKVVKVNSAGNAMTAKASDLEQSDTTHAATANATFADADEFGKWDSVTGLLRKFTFANLKTALAAACSAGWNAATATLATNATNATNATTAGTCSGNAATVTNGVYTTGNQTIAGTKTFSSPIAGSVTGSSASCTGNANTATQATNATNATVSAVVTGTAGYATGAGGAVTQITSNNTAVTINKICGSITTFDTSIGSITHFTVNNSMVSDTDVVLVTTSHGKGIMATPTVFSGGFVLYLSHPTGDLQDANPFIFNFAVIKSANA
jgi:hypothetical protein